MHPILFYGLYHKEWNAPYSIQIGEKLRKIGKKLRKATLLAERGACIVIDTESKLSRPARVGQQDDVPDIPKERFFELLSPA